MKLHLPSRLRSALLACMALLSPFAPSVSGVAVFVHSQAEAVDYIAESKTKQEITCGTGGATSGTDLTFPTDKDTITFKVSAGYLFDARSGTVNAHTIRANLKIESLVMNDGYSGGGTTAWYYFTGSVFGNGSITRTDAQNSLGFSFSGDMSGYYGNITINGGGGTDPTLDYDNILKLGNITVGTEGLAGSITINKNARLQLEGTTIWGDVTSVKTEISGTLETNFKGDFINEGSLINEGVLVVYGGEFTNKGSLINTGSISFVNSNSQVDSVGSITNSGTLNLGSKLSVNSAITNTGTINAATGGTLVFIDDLSNFFSEDTGTFSAGNNGYFSKGTFSIFSGGNVSGTFTAQYKDGEVVSVVGGKATFQSSADDQGVYWINVGTVTYDGSPATGDDSIADATKLQLNGGTLQMTSSLKEQVSQGIRVSNNSTGDFQ